MDAPRNESNWLQYLADEDRVFIKRFILASGSLKDTASIYQVSYPTVRLRLDRLIEKIKIVDDQSVTSPFERVLRAKYAEGLIDTSTLKDLLSAHRKEKEQQS
ncbi:MAG: DUF2089 family protein [Phycisphaerae bacterium]|nr:DUF2089 family protein [Phycisphaerales bacterium]